MYHNDLPQIEHNHPFHLAARLAPDAEQTSLLGHGPGGPGKQNMTPISLTSQA
jgi:hypothetical protein